MSSAFYKSISEDEIKSFGIKKESLKVAAKTVAMTYGRKALSKGKTFLEYNNPPNRCAYLYKYASIHTGLVTKYFGKMMVKKEIKKILNKKDKVKICCLGGGPGTDIVGLFKAMATFPHYHKKIIEVSVLDICGGWRNSFKRVVTNLIAGQVKNVPSTFVDVKNFKFELIQVDLLKSLPDNVVKILSEADIVCMVKFVSAILGSPTSISALETIGAKLKISAIVLFIDNFQGNVFKPLTDIAKHVGLKIVIGPLHEVFNSHNGKFKGPTSTVEKEMYGCLPLSATRVSVLSFIKVTESCSNMAYDTRIHNDVRLPSNEVDDNDDDSWDTDNESEEVTVDQVLVPETVPKVACDKFTQTYEKHMKPEISVARQDSDFGPDTEKELCLLMDSLNDLVNALNEWQQKMRPDRHCCHCHC